MESIKKNKLESFICVSAIVFTFLPTGFLFQLGISDLLVNLLEYSGLAIYALYLIFHAKKLAFNKAIMYSLIIAIIEIGTTIIQGGNIFKAVFETYKMCCILLVVYNELKDLKIYTKNFFTIMCIIYGLISGIFSLLNPFSISIFGVRTEISNYIIPIVAILIMEFSEMKFVMKTVSLITIVISVVSVYFYVDVSTAKVTLLLIFFMCFADKFFKRISVKTLITFFIVSYVGIVVFRINENLGFLIEDVLNESITLHKRTIAWDYAFELIKNSPVLGYGYIDKQYQYSILFKTTNGWFSHPHNEILRLYLLGGLPNIIAVIGMMFSTAKILQEYYYNKKIRIITYTLFVMLIMSIDETCFDSFFYVILAMGISSEYIVKMDEEKTSSGTKLTID